MYRTARAAIFACKQYAATNVNKYPIVSHLIAWCNYQIPKIEGVQHRSANIIIPILRYRKYKLI